MNEIPVFLRLDSKIVSYMVFPKFLMALDLSETAKLIYVLLLDRARLSMKQGWADENGNVYILYTLKNLSANSGKSIRTVKNALKDLDEADLIFRDKQKYGESRKIYVKMRAEFCHCGWQNTAHTVCKKLPTNKNNINKNNIDKYSFEEGESL